MAPKNKSVKGANAASVTAGIGGSTQFDAIFSRFSLDPVAQESCLAHMDISAAVSPADVSAAVFKGSVKSSNAGGGRSKAKGKRKDETLLPPKEIPVIVAKPKQNFYSSTSACKASSNDWQNIKVLEASRVAAVACGNIPPDIHTALSQLTKRDAFTRKRALGELICLLEPLDVDTLELLLPQLLFGYRKLCLGDEDRQIRCLANRLLHLLVRKMPKKLGPHLRSIVPKWLFCIHDTDSDAAKAAIEAFDEAFPLHSQEYAKVSKDMTYRHQSVDSKAAGTTDRNGPKDNISRRVAVVGFCKEAFFLEVRRVLCLDESRIEDECIGCIWQLPAHVRRNILDRHYIAAFMAVADVVLLLSAERIQNGDARGNKNRLDIELIRQDMHFILDGERSLRWFISSKSQSKTVKLAAMAALYGVLRAFGAVGLSPFLTESAKFKVDSDIISLHGCTSTEDNANADEPDMNEAAFQYFLCLGKMMKDVSICFSWCPDVLPALAGRKHTDNILERHTGATAILESLRLLLLHTLNLMHSRSAICPVWSTEDLCAVDCSSIIQELRNFFFTLLRDVNAICSNSEYILSDSFYDLFPQFLAAVPPKLLIGTAQGMQFVLDFPQAILNPLYAPTKSGVRRQTVYTQSTEGYVNSCLQRLPVGSIVTCFYTVALFLLQKRFIAHLPVEAEDEENPAETQSGDFDPSVLLEESGIRKKVLKAYAEDLLLLPVKMYLRTSMDGECWTKAIPSVFSWFLGELNGRGLDHFNLKFVAGVRNIILSAANAISATQQRINDDNKFDRIIVILDIFQQNDNDHNWSTRQLAGEFAAAILAAIVQATVEIFGIDLKGIYHSSGFANCSSIDLSYNASDAGLCVVPAEDLHRWNTLLEGFQNICTRCLLPMCVDLTEGIYKGEESMVACGVSGSARWLLSNGVIGVLNSLLFNMPYTSLLSKAIHQRAIGGKKILDLVVVPLIQNVLRVEEEDEPPIASKYSAWGYLEELARKYLSIARNEFCPSKVDRMGNWRRRLFSLQVGLRILEVCNLHILKKETKGVDVASIVGESGVYFSMSSCFSELSELLTNTEERKILLDVKFCQSLTEDMIYILKAARCVRKVCSISVGSGAMAPEVDAVENDTCIKIQSELMRYLSILQNNGEYKTPSGESFFTQIYFMLVLTDEWIHSAGGYRQQQQHQQQVALALLDGLLKGRYTEHDDCHEFERWVRVVEVFRRFLEQQTAAQDVLMGVLRKTCSLSYTQDGGYESSKADSESAIDFPLPALWGISAAIVAKALEVYSVETNVPSNCFSEKDFRLRVAAQDAMFLDNLLPMKFVFLGMNTSLSADLYGNLESALTSWILNESADPPNPVWTASAVAAFIRERDKRLGQQPPVDSVNHRGDIECIFGLTIEALRFSHLESSGEKDICLLSCARLLLLASASVVCRDRIYLMGACSKTCCIQKKFPFVDMLLKCGGDFASVSILLLKGSELLFEGMKRSVSADTSGGFADLIILLLKMLMTRGHRAGDNVIREFLTHLVETSLTYGSEGTEDFNRYETERQYSWYEGERGTLLAALVFVANQYMLRHDDKIDRVHLESQSMTDAFRNALTPDDKESDYVWLSAMKRLNIHLGIALDGEIQELTEKRSLSTMTKFGVLSIAKVALETFVGQCLDARWRGNMRTSMMGAGYMLLDKWKGSQLKISPVEQLQEDDRARLINGFYELECICIALCGWCTLMYAQRGDEDNVRCGTGTEDLAKVILIAALSCSSSVLRMILTHAEVFKSSFTKGDAPAGYRRILLIPAIYGAASCIIQFLKQMKAEKAKLDAVNEPHCSSGTLLCLRWLVSVLMVSVDFLLVLDRLITDGCTELWHRNSSLLTRLYGEDILSVGECMLEALKSVWTFILSLDADGLKQCFIFVVGPLLALNVQRFRAAASELLQQLPWFSKPLGVCCPHTAILPRTQEKFGVDVVGYGVQMKDSWHTDAWESAALVANVGSCWAYEKESGCSFLSSKSNTNDNPYLLGALAVGCHKKVLNRPDLFSVLRFVEVACEDDDSNRGSAADICLDTGVGQERKVDRAKIGTKESFDGGSGSNELSEEITDNAYSIGTSVLRIVLELWVGAAFSEALMNTYAVATKYLVAAANGSLSNRAAEGSGCTSRFQCGSSYVFEHQREQEDIRRDVVSCLSTWVIVLRFLEGKSSGRWVSQLGGDLSKSVEVTTEETSDSSGEVSLDELFFSIRAVLEVAPSSLGTNFGAFPEDMSSRLALSESELLSIFNLPDKKGGGASVERHKPERSFARIESGVYGEIFQPSPNKVIDRLMVSGTCCDRFEVRKIWELLKDLPLNHVLLELLVAVLSSIDEVFRQGEDSTFVERSFSTMNYGSVADRCGEGLQDDVTGSVAITCACKFDWHDAALNDAKHGISTRTGTSASDSASSGSSKWSMNADVLGAFEKREECLIRCPPISELEGAASNPSSVWLLAAHVYSLLLKTYPVVVRRVINQTSFSRARRFLQIFSETLVTPWLIRDEVQQAKSFAETESGSCLYDWRERVVHASFRDAKDEFLAKISVNFPRCFPLVQASIQIPNGGLPGVSQAKMNTWRIAAHRGVNTSSLAIGLSLFRQNVRRYYEGVADCPICFMAVHMQHQTLPRKKCAVCKNKFHSECLYKWFRTSHKAKCPLCQSNF